MMAHDYESLSSNFLSFPRYKMPIRTYAGMKAYTVELRALTRFGNTPVLTLLSNFELLEQKMKKLGESYDVQNLVGKRDERKEEDSMIADLETRTEPDLQGDSDTKSCAPNTLAHYFPLLIRNLARNVTNKFLQEKFARWKSIQYV